MKKLIYICVTFLALFTIQSCEDSLLEADLNYVAFGKASYSTSVPVSGSTTVDIPVYTSNITGADRTFNVAVDAANSTAAAGSFTVPGSVTIPGGTNEGTLSVALSDVDLGIGNNAVVIKFDMAEEGLNTGSSTTVNYIQQCEEITATLDINFDYYSEETGWYITDALGGTVVEAEAGTYADYKRGSVSESITLCAGRDYTLVFTDEFSDGMDDGGVLGDYTLTIGGVVKVTGGGAFGASESTAFDTK
ncbi:hypothetical protein [Gaetbulibacter aestuarii]|uniref:DUF1735 domain-containing protein n=1 Tax=Gaetbulibacter aestuarii TaxID=1502358 RepID=A0ABW7MWK5_9FLAO